MSLKKVLCQFSFSFFMLLLLNTLVVINRVHKIGFSGTRKNGFKATIWVMNKAFHNFLSKFWCMAAYLTIFPNGLNYPPLWDEGQQLNVFFPRILKTWFFYVVFNAELNGTIRIFWFRCSIIDLYCGPAAGPSWATVGQ